MRSVIPFIGFFLFILAESAAQDDDSLTFLYGIVYDISFKPVPYTHVIGINSHYGDITDTLGIFLIPITEGDTLLFRNIAFNDTLIAVEDLKEPFFICMQKRYYPLQEAKIFDWGTTYDDFKKAITNMPKQESPGEKLGLPRQDPGYIPFDMDEDQLKSLDFLFHSPVSFLYYNLSRKEKSAREVYWLNKNREKIEFFNSVFNRKVISEITGLEGEGLDLFMVYLNDHFICDYNCSELKIITEIHHLWNKYILR